MNDFKCYTMQQGNTLNFLKPVSLSATIGLSTRPSKSEVANKLGAFTQDLEEETSAIGCLGVCVHIDMSPITISISEAQVCLIASITYGLMSVLEHVSPKGKSEQKSPEATPPVIVRNPPQSPTVLQKESTQESTSEQSAPLTIQDNEENENVKLTAWIQWTIARFTVKVYTNSLDMLANLTTSYAEQPTMKLVLDAEDIVSSLDFQSVYLKIKNKVGTANIKHYERLKGGAKWTPGAFRGLVMIPIEEAVPPERQEDTSFFGVTITRASCQHTHTLWGANRRSKLTEKVSVVRRAKAAERTTKTVELLSTKSCKVTECTGNFGK